MIIPDVNIASPTSGVSNVVQQDPYGLKGTSEVMSIESDLMLKKETRDADAYEIKTRPDFQISLQKAMEESRVEAETPDQMTELFLEKSKSVYDNIYEAAPNQIAKRKIEERFSQYQTAYGSQMVRMQAEENQNLRILSVGQAVDKYAAQIGVNGNYEANVLGIEAAIKDAEAFTSPLEMEKIRLQAMGNAKQVKLDYELSNNNFKEVTRLINDPVFSEGLTAKEIQAYRDTVTQAKTKLEKVRFTDPAGYIMIQNPDATLDEVYNSQGGLGASRAIMPQETAKGIVAQVNTFQDSKQMKEFLTNVQRNYGKYAPNALRDLRKAGLSASYSYATELDPVEDSERIDLLFDTIRQEQGKDGKLISGAKLIEDNVKSKLNGRGETLEKTFTEPFEAAYSIQDQIYADMQLSPAVRANQREQSRLLALSHYDKHGDVDAAIKFSTEHLFRGAKIERIGGVQIPIPETQKINEVKKGAEILQDSLEVISTNINGLPQRVSGMVLRSGSKWVANEDNTGLILTDLNGVPLRTEAGMAEYKWKDLEEASRQGKDLTVKETVDKMVDMNKQIEALAEKNKANKKKGLPVSKELPKDLPQLPEFKLKKQPKANGSSSLGNLNEMIDQ